MTVTAFYVPAGDLPSFWLFRCLTIRQIGQLRHRGPHVCPPISIRFETSQCHENYVCYDLDFPLFSLYFRGSKSAQLCARRRAFELAGVEFIDENGGGPGGWLRTRQRTKQPD
jgi:hypothetical protein